MFGMGNGWGWFLGIVMGGVYTFSANYALAQSKIIPDNTLGAEKSNVIPNYNGLPIEVINNGAIRGQNLFHSFLEFNVSEGRGAYFFSPSANIQNIVTRVTGSDRSEILGVLGTFGNSNPNLFFINPNGIIFGPNARLDVGGSFAATTANAIQFGNLGTFSATTPDAPSPLLTINPSALLYNQIAAAASIQNSSIASAGKDPSGFDAFGLRVPDGKSLLLVGGNISMDGGQLNAYGGRVELGGLASSGTVGIQVNGNDLNLSFPDNITRSDVSLVNGASVYVEAGGGGSITVNANNINIKSGSTLNAGIAQGLGSVGALAGNITLNATGDIKIDGNESYVSNSVEQQGVGNGGNIILSSNSFSLTSGAQLNAITFSQGNAGNVIINTTKSVSFDGRYTNSNGQSFPSGILSTVGDFGSNQNSLAKGNGGNIQITTDQLSLSSRAQLTTDTYGQGNAGNITLNVSSLFLASGAQLVASTDGQGNAGNVIINATKGVSFDGGDTNSNGQIGPSSILSNVGDLRSNQNSLIKGNGGNIQITTDQLSLTNGAQLEASNFGQGNAGNVIINATKGVSFNGVYTNSNGQVFPSGILSNVGDVSSNQNSLTKGNGGNIQITTDQLSLTNDAQLQASTFGQGNAGNVIINATKGVFLDGKNTIVVSSVGAPNDAHNDVAIGKGGSIEIKTDQLSLINSAQLNATTFGQGNAGNITLNASSLSLASGAELLTSTLGQGNAGNVIINATKSGSLNGGDTNSNGLFVSSGIFSNVGDVSSNQNSLIKGNGGNIQITTGQLSLTNGAQLEASTYGQGNAGSVIINATRSVSFDGGDTNSNGLFVSSGIFSNVGDVGSAQNNLVKGNSGNIQITTEQLSLTNGAALVASTLGQGNAGNVIINATKSVSLDGQAAIFSTVGGVNNSQNNLAIGNGGNIQITTDQLSLTNSAQLQASTFGQGNAGSVIINATKGVFLNGNNTAVIANVGAINDPHNDVANGNAGNIQITTDQLLLTNGAQLQAGTSGQGNAGNVIINATKSVSLDRSGILNTVGDASSNQNNLVNGKGGSIEINTSQLSLINGAQLQASTYGQGNAGNVIINATKGVSFDGGDTNSNGQFFPSGILSNVGDVGSAQNDLAKGNGGNIQITTDQLSLTNGAQISTSTYGQGNAGNVIINATKGVSFSGGGYANSNGLFFRSGILSDVGDIISNQNSLTKGNGGNIQITTDQLSLTNGTQLVASTFGQGNAGNVIINATRIVSLDGNRTAILSTVGDPGLSPQQNNIAQGKGGDIQIQSSELSLTNGAQLNASTFGQSDAGNLEISARSIRLDSGSISSQTNSGNGGNITLTPFDLLLLRHGSKISTTAGIAQLGGNGGNITVNAPNGFIVAIPNENSNITANAFSGSGGQIQINATSVFGLTVLSREDLIRLLGNNDLAQLDFQQLPTSAITAVSQTNPTLNGTVVLNTANINPSKGLVQLSTNLINPNTLLANSCIARTQKQQGTFYITGSGGLPNHPGDASISSYPTGTVRNVGGNSTSSSWHKGDPIVEPQGVYQLPNGHLVLSRECS